MDILFEQRIVQNAALAAEAIWHAVQEAYETSGRTQGVMLPLAFLILPLTFHRRTARTLATKTRSAAIYKSVAEDGEMTLGLQARMVAMYPRTREALLLGLQSNLLSLDDGDQFRLLPGRRTEPVVHVSESVKTILGAARRIGYAFAEMSPTQLAAQLDVRF